MITAGWTEVAGYVGRRTADFAVADLSAVSGDRRFETIPLSRQPLSFVCRPGHPLARSDELLAADVMAYPITGPIVPAREAGLFAADATAGSIDTQTGEFVPAIVTDDLDMALRIVMSSDAVTAVTLTSAEPLIESDQLVVLDVRDNALRTNYGLIWLQGRSLAPASSTLIGEIIQTDAELDSREKWLRERYALGPLP
jgi:DNA-binding transcriptional LysR family regulator